MLKNNNNGVNKKENITLQKLQDELKRTSSNSQDSIKSNKEKIKNDYDYPILSNKDLSKNRVESFDSSIRVQLNLTGDLALEFQKKMNETNLDRANLAKYIISQNLLKK